MHADVHYNYNTCLIMVSSMEINSGPNTWALLNVKEPEKFLDSDPDYQSKRNQLFTANSIQVKRISNTTSLMQTNLVNDCGIVYFKN